MAFHQIIGHKSQIKVLQNSWQKRTLAHAYLFLGQEGIGKETLARQLAKALNCEKGDGDACDLCPVCRRIDANTFSDCYRLSPSGASQTIKMEEVQSLQKSLTLSRFEGKAKVILISEADCLNEASSNALLKILEEPIARTYFFLISSNHEAILATIRSRCRQVAFYPLADNEVELILTQKGVEEAAQRELLVRLSEGSVGQALRFFSEEGKKLRQSVVKFALIKSPSPTEALFASEQLQKMVEEKKEVIWDILKIFQGVYRDLILIHLNGDAKQLFNPDWIQGLQQMKEVFSASQLEAKIEMIERIRADLHMNAQVKFALDYLLLFLANKEENLVYS